MARKRKRSKRANGESGITDLGNDRFRVEVELPRASNGQRRRKTRTIRGSRSDAVEALRELHNEVATGSAVEPEDMPVAEWLRKRHELFAIGDVSADWVESCRRAVESHLIPHLGDVLLLSRLTPAHVEEMLGGWAEAGLGMRSREIAFRVLRKAVEVARGRGHVRCDPFHGVIAPRAETTKVDPYTADEMRAILRAAKGERLEALWVLAFSVGMRIGEMLALSPRCLDLESGTLRVERTGKYRKGKLLLSPPKTERSRRTIELPARAVAALAEHRKQTLAEGHAGCDFVFPSEAGTMIHLERLRVGVWKRITKRAGVEKKPIHQTRHTYATLALMAGVPVPVVSAVLGHASADITLRIYAHYVPGHQRLAREAMDRLFLAGG